MANGHLDESFGRKELWPVLMRNLKKNRGSFGITAAEIGHLKDSAGLLTLLRAEGIPVSVEVPAFTQPLDGAQLARAEIHGEAVNGANLFSSIFRISDPKDRPNPLGAGWFVTHDGTPFIPDELVFDERIPNLLPECMMQPALLALRNGRPAGEWSGESGPGDWLAQWLSDGPDGSYFRLFGGSLLRRSEFSGTVRWERFRPPEASYRTRFVALRDGAVWCMTGSNAHEITSRFRREGKLWPAGLRRELAATTTTAGARRATLKRRRATRPTAKLAVDSPVVPTRVPGKLFRERCYGRRAPSGAGRLRAAARRGDRRNRRYPGAGR